MSPAATQWVRQNCLDFVSVCLSLYEQSHLHFNGFRSNLYHKLVPWISLLLKKKQCLANIVGDISLEVYILGMGYRILFLFCDNISQFKSKRIDIWLFYIFSKSCRKLLELITQLFFYIKKYNIYYIGFLA